MISSPRIALGAAQFGLNYGVTNCGGKVSRGGVESILTVARSCGIDTLDTAMAYGESEVVLGSVGISDFDVITKLPRVPVTVSNVENWIFQNVLESLNKLRIKRLGGLLLHQPSQLQEERGLELIRGLEIIKAEGLVDRIGISIYSPLELDSIMKLWSPDIVQTPLNPLDRRVVKSGWLERLQGSGVEVHVRSIFLQGILLAKGNDLPKYFLKWEALLSRWQSWLLAQNISAVDACVAFASSYPEVSRIVVGVTNSCELRKIADAAVLSASNCFPEIESDDEYLINPQNWPPR